MNEYTFDGTLSPIERETIFTYNDEERKWEAETSVRKHYNRLLKQGWTQTSITLTPDGKFVSAEFEACDKALSIGRAERPKREISPEHLEALKIGLKNANNKNRSETP